MASNDKKAKADPAPKKVAAPADKSAAAATPPKTDGGEKTAAPASYSRGEGQKAVTQAYKDNWDAIFAKKKKKR